ncbi:beta-lactamase/transpeptidase-like protein [Boeremia exigua]|uniref:beta-lactamase/transpeptidase-like protein n=1 Tax=Boeremia exigua TaxID=749465 RepID=UPI001E8D084F|nr:beta-lactamase/transpeptidase-like protein [Boeremia exigua]KAH6616876.1 beta-lactamase/transpeptidase-like protein [Boeremia exigua]
MISKSLLHYATLVVTTTASICPILGPVFPAPRDLSSSVAFQDALKGLQLKLDEAFMVGNTTHGRVNPNDTFSIQVFSTESEEPLFDYHRRGPAVLGNRTVDGDSIYRIASGSKLITVYLLLLEAGEVVLRDKVTEYLPQLAGVSIWDEMTVGALTGYLGDIVGDLYEVSSIPGGDLAAAFPGAFPPLTENEISGCNYLTGCTSETFLQNLKGRPSAYLPNTTPAYSNTGFATLGLIVEAVANSTFEEVLRKRLVAPLRLTGTTISQPKDLTNAVIPGSESRSGWNYDLSDTPSAAEGGLFSTPNDMSAIGRAILSSSLLPNATTRSWFKPTGLTSSLIGAVGHGWEIYRASYPEHNRVIDLYVKGGNLPGYGSNFILIPDFNVGFIMMMAGQRGSISTPVAALIIDEILPALDEAARVQADAALAGTYAASNGLNSTVKISSTPGIPGLTIEEWVSNSTDMHAIFVPPTELFQMFPTNIVSEDGKQVSWRSTSVFLPDTGSPLDACASWVAIDRPTYGIYGLDEFVFHLGDDGKAHAIEPRALKIVLERV